MKHQRGANKFEFAITVVIFGVLATALLARLNAIQEEAERTEVELTVRNIRVGIQLAIGERIMRGEEDIASAKWRWPVRSISSDTSRAASPMAKLRRAPGQWSYDPVRRELGYQPRIPGAFADAAELRWRYVARVDSSGRTVGVSLVGIN
jgi:type II secretory pathway pseudopilin PulG